jgi:hypothetical protein
MGSSFYNSTTRELDIVISSSGADFARADDQVGKISTSARLCPPNGCPSPPKFSALTNYTKWSDSSTWVGIGGSPTAGQTFNISDTQWVVLDVSTPPLGCLIVYGRLSFMSGMNITLTAQCIQVFGILEINGYITSNGYNESHETFNGTADIVLYGSKTVVKPLIMGEGLFIGSKYLGIAGMFTARGAPRTQFQSKLNSTASMGSSSISVISTFPLDWVIGDELVIAATGYFNSAGQLWSDMSAPGNEKRIITAISRDLGSSLTTFSLDSPLQQTHICMIVASESFCASVGLLTRNIRISSKDITGADDGFGGHISVVDILGDVLQPESLGFVGQIDIAGVQMVNMGKINTNYYGIGIIYRQSYNASSYNSIVNCSFSSFFNFAVHASFSNNLTIDNNVIYDVYSGGIYIDNTCSEVAVTNNMVLSTHQTPSIFLNGYPWTVPIAAYTFNTFLGVYSNNLAAGSYDTGFSVVTGIFSGYSGIFSPNMVNPLYSSILSVNPCAITKGNQNKVNVSVVIENSIFKSNEAVGCRVGLMVVNDDIAESTTSTCAVVSGIKAWRNAHMGIGGVDAIANTLLSNVVVAENHIGISFSYYRTADNGFSGVANSKIIGSLSSNACIGDSPTVSGTNWAQKCQVFSFHDPYGLSASCESVFGSSGYTRVGVLIPQSTNGGKTCRIAGRFQSGTCSPSIYPDRLCGLPWEKRYGLPGGDLYVEHQLFNNLFTGFSSDPSCPATHGAAVALNPSQIDIQPVVVSSQLKWDGQSNGLMDMNARLGMSISSEFVCAEADCMGHHLLLIHDVNGFLAGSADGILTNTTLQNNITGQIYFDNPSYSSSDSGCIAADNLGVQLYSCLYPQSPFLEYTGLWRDEVEGSGDASVGPVQISRSSILYKSDVRSYSSYSAKMDLWYVQIRM